MATKPESRPATTSSTSNTTPDSKPNRLLREVVGDDRSLSELLDSNPSRPPLIEQPTGKPAKRKRLLQS